ncbi:VENN motif pre-toxin domain-containing protein [Pectobacterium odoriferum]|uniref:VENN motif pre-toxin domain-containing protein n=1 Tax=Pectobacterium odoriferum TaxID=78398 RepID=UPI0027E414A8|nr:VENN motif pre-toxin domain-containing protein [Pectobacterium odoriferum]
MDIVRTEGELKAQKAAEAKGDSKVKRPEDGDSVAMWEDYKKTLTESPTYKAEMQKYGTGSDFQRAAQAATAAIQALAGGDIQKAIASGASPYLAQLVKDVTIPKDESKITASDIAANAMAHAVVGAIVAQLSGQDAAAGAMGASSGELIARAIMADQYPGKTANDLTEEEKQSVSALSTLASGLVSGLAGNSTASAASGAQSGRNAVENNSLSVSQIEDFAVRAKGCEARGDCKQIVKEMEDLSLNQQKEMIAVCASDASACKDKYGDIPANGMLVREALDRLFDADVPSQMKNDISSFWAQQMEAEGVVSGTEFAQGLQSRYGIDKQQAEILAGAVLGAVTGGMGKGGKTSENSVKNPVRFIEGVTVKDIKTGQIFSGTVDLKPTLERIASGGAYPHRNDGTVFKNLPDRGTGKIGLPSQPIGYYKEYVHPTPNISGPGPQRVIVGQSGEAYYTNDHYKTFIKIR